MNAKDGDIEEFKTGLLKLNRKRPFCSRECRKDLAPAAIPRNLNTRQVHSSAVPEPERAGCRGSCQMAEAFPDYNHADGGKAYHYPLNVIAVFQGKSAYSVPRGGTPSA